MSGAHEEVPIRRDRNIPCGARDLGSGFDDAAILVDNRQLCGLAVGSSERKS